MLAQLFGTKKPSVVGLDISSTSVKLLELGRVGSRYRVEAYAVEPLPQDAVSEREIREPEAVGEAIKRVLSRSKSSIKNAAVAVAGSAVITKVIQMDKNYSEDDMESQMSVVVLLPLIHQMEQFVRWLAVTTLI